MKKVVTIHQPDFAPWLGFFHRWNQADQLIVLDDVQFIRRGWQHRDQIKTQQGPQWLSIPVKKSGKFHQEIREVEIDSEQDWRAKHLGTLEQAYKKAAHYSDFFPKLQACYAQPFAKLMDFNLAVLQMMAAEFAITTPLVFASHLSVSTASTERLVDLCRRTEASAYLTGSGSKDYLEEDKFKAAGIEVMWQAYEPPTYPQLHGDFVPKLSAIDYLMNCDGAKGLFRRA